MELIQKILNKPDVCLEKLDQCGIEKVCKKFKCKYVGPRLRNSRSSSKTRESRYCGGNSKTEENRYPLQIQYNCVVALEPLENLPLPKLGSEIVSSKSYVEGDIVDCFRCSRKMRVEHYETHLENHYNIEYKCYHEDCGWEFKHFPSLQGHMYRFHQEVFGPRETTHSDEWSTTDTCDTDEDDDKGSKDNSKFSKKKGIRIKRKRRKRIRCKFCSATFDRLSELKRHFCRHDVYILGCENKTKSASPKLVKPRTEKVAVFADVHEGCGSQILCNTLNKDEEQWRDTEAHTEQNSRENDNVGVVDMKPEVEEMQRVLTDVPNRIFIPCPECKRPFLEESKVRYSRHVEEHNRLKYQCPEEECKWKFKTFTSLQIHFCQKHVKELPTKNANTEASGKEAAETRTAPNNESASSQNSIRSRNTNVSKGHRSSCLPRRDIGNKPVGHVCPYCNRYFDIRRQCAEHTERHIYMKHKCVCCGWMYEEYSYLQSHYQSDHTRQELLKAQTTDQPSVVLDLTQAQKDETELEDIKPRIASIRKSSSRKKNTRRNDVGMHLRHIPGMRRKYGAFSSIDRDLGARPRRNRRSFNGVVDLTDDSAQSVIILDEAENHNGSGPGEFSAGTRRENVIIVDSEPARANGEPSLDTIIPSDGSSFQAPSPAFEAFNSVMDQNAMVANPQCSNPEYSNTECSNPECSNTECSNTECSNTEYSNTEYSNPEYSNPVIAPVTPIVIQPQEDDASCNNEVPFENSELCPPDPYGSTYNDVSSLEASSIEYSNGKYPTMHIDSCEVDANPVSTEEMEIERPFYFNGARHF